uniref:Extracellular matrix protein 1 n=1 Tax=Stegastes partitus TaxID=144197 RepID=A0A3B4ZQR7_9TELE
MSHVEKLPSLPVFLTPPRFPLNPPAAIKAVSTLPAHGPIPGRCALRDVSSGGQTEPDKQNRTNRDTTTGTMGSSWLLFCSAALLLVFPGSASEEIVEPEPFMLQKEVDLSELLDPKEFPVEQVRVSPPKPNQREQGPPSFGPRTFGGPPALNYRVQFPLARPTSNNLQAICLHRDHRPRYPNSYFPASGFGQLRRRASGVNNAESWFDTCCQGNQTWEREVTLCCATQAWELFVETFCEEDSSVKDRLYNCCKLRGADRLNCFDRDSPNPNYEPTEVLPVEAIPPTTSFSFDPNTCRRTQMTPYSARVIRKKKAKKAPASQNVNISFPPGRPTADAIESLCSHQTLRPLYQTRCLPRSGFGWLARQAKTVNRIEKGFKQCCKKKQDVLSCVDQKWSDEIDRFCSAENGEQADFSCCSSQSPADRYSCFHSMSPDPHYNKTSAPEELSLNNICDTHKVIDKRFPVGFPVKSIVKQCCRLPEVERTACFAQKLEETSKKLCLSGGRSPATVRHCCKLPSQETPQCISKILMNAISKATNAVRQKQRKTCPLS